jgi:hypothetical protein
MAPKWNRVKLKPNINGDCLVERHPNSHLIRELAISTAMEDETLKNMSSEINKLHLYIRLLGVVRRKLKKA